jgi:hypothetical protein
LVLLTNNLYSPVWADATRPLYCVTPQPLQATRFVTVCTPQGEFCLGDCRYLRPQTRLFLLLKPSPLIVIVLGIYRLVYATATHFVVLGASPQLSRPSVRRMDILNDVPCIIYTANGSPRALQLDVRCVPDVRRDWQPGRSRLASSIDLLWVQHGSSVGWGAAGWSG